MRDGQTIAYGKVVCDYLTSWQPNKDFNGHAFLHTRELALDKTTGLLCVLDTIESKGDVRAAFGPIWHIQQRPREERPGISLPERLSGQDGRQG